MRICLWNTPLFSQPGLELIFLSVVRMVSCETLSTCPKRTNRSLSKRKLQTFLPSGGALQANAIKCASASPSKACWYSLSGFLRSNVACNPFSTKLLRTFSTVTGVMLNAAQICSYFHFGPAALLSDLSRICARVTLRAGAFPEEVSFSRCCRSSSVNSMIVFLVHGLLPSCCGFPLR